MIKIGFILIIILFINSCSLTLYIPEQNIPVKVNNIQEALAYVDNNYNYIPHYGVFTPEEFYNNGYGDCEDFSMMLLYLFNQQLGVESYFIIGTYNNSLSHAWIETKNGDWYDATAGSFIYIRELYQPIYRYSYTEAIRSIWVYGGFLPDVNYYEDK